MKKNNAKILEPAKELIKLSPDFYLRYYLGFEIIKKTWGKKSCQILDVGGRGGILGDFIRNENLPYKLTVLDILPDDKNSPTTCDKYIRADFLKEKINRNFDVVTSFDVLEHIEEKEKFLARFLKLGKIAILAAPFESFEVCEAERLANNFFLKYTGKDHPWLKEHFEAKLPEKKWFEDFLKEKSYSFSSLSSNYLPNWLFFILPNFLPAFIEVNHAKLQDINRYYNHNFLNLGDLNHPGYRDFYIISKKQFPDFSLSSRFDYNKQLAFEKMIIDFLSEALAKLVLSEGRLKATIQSQQQVLTQKEEQVTQLTSERAQLAQEMAQLQATVQSQQQKLKGIYSSLGWELINKYRGIKDSILRKGTRRRRIYDLVLKGIKTSLKGSKHLPIGIDKELDHYRQWIAQDEPKPEDLERQKEESLSFHYRPKISIITPVWNPEPKWLKSAIKSVLNQTYDNWELCLADGNPTKIHVKRILKEYAKKDSRIKVKFLPENKGISGNSNEALSLTTGEFIGLLDHDDELAPEALYEVVKLLNKHPDADMIYSDEDKLELDGKRVDPYFKPDWSPDLLLSHMYTCHLGIYRKSLVDRFNGFRLGYEGAQDYDLVLRLTEKTDRIYHIPKILYHWRKAPGSAAALIGAKPYAIKAEKRALEDALRRRRIRGEVLVEHKGASFRVKRAILGQPKVTIIIPTKDKVKLLGRCIESVKEKTSYKNYEIVIVDNNSKKRETKRYLKNLPHTVLEFRKPFNFAEINNFAVKKTKGEHLLFLNNDTEVINEGWLEAMLEHSQRKEVGAVGAKLLYPNNTIQHAGVVLGMGGVAGHSHKHFPAESHGYFGSLDLIRNYSAVTGACLMMRRDVFEEVEMFEEKLSHAFNDVDLCLKIRKKGYLIVWTPFARLYHLESASRPKVVARFERKYMLRKWRGLLKNDPYYNPNLALNREDFGLRI